MDTLVVLVDSLVGQIMHVVKKRTEGKEESESEWDVLRKWIFARPVNTLSATVVGWSVTMGMVSVTEAGGKVLVFCGAGYGMESMAPKLLALVSKKAEAA